MLAKDKGNKIANVPNLRFREFDGEWRTCVFSDIGTFFKGVGISKEQLTEEGTPCILYGELYTKYKNEVIKEVKSKTSINTNGLVFSKANDVIIPSSGETAVDISTACCITIDNILLGGDLNIIRPKKHNGSFISYQLNGKRKYDIAKIAQGSSIIHLYNDSLKKIKINVPIDIKEEDKIVSLLSQIDDRISTQIQTIEEFKTLQTSLINSYYSLQRHKKIILLSDCIVQKSERNKKNEDYPVLSVSNKFGFIRQSEQFENREVASEDTSNYKIVRKNDFAYNPARINVGSVARLTNYDNGIVSPMYVCFHTKDNFLSDFLEFYFSSQLFKNEMKKRLEGSVRQCLTFESLYDIPICFPSLEEQQAISLRLVAIQKKIDIENGIRDLFVQQKKYLLSQMFI